MRAFGGMLCALLLAPLAAPAQDEPAAGEPVAEEAPAEEVPAEGEAAPEEGAGQPAGWFSGALVELYSMPAAAYTVKEPSSTERGDGFGGRGMLRLFGFLAVTAEYATRTFDDVDEDLTETGFGLGATVASDNGDVAGLFVESDTLDFGTRKLDGHSVHARVFSKPAYGLGFTTDVGYVFLQDDVEDQEGFELTLGLGYGWGLVGIFGGWHFLDLEGQDSGARAQLSDARAGVRLSF